MVVLCFKIIDPLSYFLDSEEFEKEQSSSNPYRPKVLYQAKQSNFPNLVREAVQSGNEGTLPSLPKVFKVR
jgi:hypothetical protein